MKNKPQTIASRINQLLAEEGISAYEFCKQENLLDKRQTFERAITKGNPDEVNPIFINRVYKGKESSLDRDKIIQDLIKEKLDYKEKYDNLKKKVADIMICG